MIDLLRGKDDGRRLAPLGHRYLGDFLELAAAEDEANPRPSPERAAQQFLAAMFGKQR